MKRRRDGRRKRQAFKRTDLLTFTNISWIENNKINKDAKYLRRKRNRERDKERGVRQISARQRDTSYTTSTE